MKNQLNSLNSASEIATYFSSLSDIEKKEANQIIESDSQLSDFFSLNSMP